MVKATRQQAALIEQLDELRSTGAWPARTDSIGKFLRGEGAYWRPIPIEARHGARRWHPMFIWRSCARGKVELKAAVAAITKHLSREEVGEIVCSAEDWPVTYSLMRDLGDWRRDRAISLALLDWLERNDEKWPTRAVEFAEKGRSPNTGLALLRAWGRKRLKLGPAIERPIQDAVLFVVDNVPDGVVDLARKLPADWRERAVHQTDDRETVAQLRALLA